MKLNHIILALAVLLCFSCQNEKKDNLVLWYNSPAQNWDEALPIGNGNIGAMVFGKPDDELLQLNDNTLYSGDPSVRWCNVDITPTYDEVVNMLRDKKYVDAHQFIEKNWMWRLHQNYQPLGDWHLTSNVKGEISDYKRELDITNSVMRISYKQNGVTYTREIFASNPDGVIVMKLQSDDKNGLDITTSLSSIHPTAKQTIENGVVKLSGQAPGYVERRTLKQLEAWGVQNRHPEYFNEDGSRKYNKQVLYGDEIGNMGMYFETRIKALSPKANIVAEGEGLRISGTNEVVLILSSATSFNGFDKSPTKEGANAVQKADDAVGKAAAKPYKQLLADHKKDYNTLFSRVSLNMQGSEEQELMPTDERIINYGEKQDNGLVTLLFQYGRYLMISGSREGGQPLNLQGIWNKDLIPAWNSAYTANINAEMNYWAAETGNLTECHQPFLQMIKEIAVTGAETAKNMYKRNGWAAHHNVSIWRETYPNDGNAVASFWPMLGAWLCSHYWEHYLFNGDKEFLKNEAYPLMKGASEFFKDWLVDNGEGFLVTPVSTSPENWFLTEDGKRASVSMGSTMDMALIKELFTRTIVAAEMFDIDPDFRAELQGKLQKLLPYRIGGRGQLQEWQYDYPEAEPRHRHISHLYGLHPGNQINIDNSPELFNAVKRTLELRGDAATGWSMGWKINCWARLLDGDHANIIIKNLFSPVGFGDKKHSGGGLFKNMLDAHPPFQIDGNFGFTAGVIEMLTQSHAGYIHLLPALPSTWVQGKITGIKARGGFIVDIEWNNGKLVSAKITSTLGGNCRLRTSDKIQVKGVELIESSSENPNSLFATVNATDFQNFSEEKANIVPHNYHTVDFNTEKGKTYTVTIVQ